MTEMRTIVVYGPSGAADDYQLYGCRMTGRGCEQNDKTRIKRRCSDCYGPLPKQTTMPSQRLHTLIVGVPK
jgi:hypothetical protein